MMLGIKDAPELTLNEVDDGPGPMSPSDWEDFLKATPGQFVIIGDRPESEAPEYVSAPWDRATAQRIFDEVVEACDFAARPGYRVRIVAVER